MDRRDGRPTERDEMDALGDAYSRKYDRGGRSRARGPSFGAGGGARAPVRASAGPPVGHVSRSHEQNEEYMDEMHSAYGLGPREQLRTRVADGGPLGRDSSARRGGAAAAGSGAAGGFAGGPAVGDLPRLSSAWVAGPSDPAGTVIDLSGRPVLCSALDPSRRRVALGCSDHAVYELSLDSGRVIRTLFTKRYGHCEWVTSVAYLADGTLASAAMDAKICVWSPSGVRCTDMTGHSGSISALVGIGSSIVSTGYDQTVRVWDSRSGAETALLAGHRAPVLCVAVDGASRAVTGGRDALACAWDIGAGARIGRMAGHKGHVTAARWLGDGVTRGDGGGAGDLFATGAQDGHVRVWDLRARRAVANVAVHVTEAGAGAVGDIGVCTATSPFDVVTSGADQRVCVLDSRRGFSVRWSMDEHRDYVYSLAVGGRIALSGAGDGTLLAHDVVAGRPLWALGANEAAVRCIECDGDTVVASGDDGNAIVYKAG